MAQQILAEAVAIGDLQDAGAAGALKSIEFKGLFLNAPVVHSRYVGLFQGMIIAEAALFALGRFEFTFEPVFTQVSVQGKIAHATLAVQESL